MKSMGILLCVVALALHSATAQEAATLEQLTSCMTGDFSNEAQAKDNKDFNHIELHMVEIWKRDDAVWLYVEQAQASEPKRPYIQQIYRLEEAGTNRFIYHVYDLPNTETWVGAWKKPRKFKNLTPAHLTPKEKCSIGMYYDSGVFKGATESFCPNDWQGATVAASEVAIEAEKIMRWDRGLDEEGNQVWGPHAGGYLFIKE